MKKSTFSCLLLVMLGHLTPLFPMDPANEQDRQAQVHQLVGDTGVERRLVETLIDNHRATDRCLNYAFFGVLVASLWAGAQLMEYCANMYTSQN